MNRQLIPTLVLWLAITVLGEVLAATVDFYIVPMSDKGEEIDAAFRFLVYMSVPVFALVVAVLITSVALRSSVRFPDEDGLPLEGRGPFPIFWVGVTSCLALVIMVYPGLVGIPRVVRQTNNPDVLVKVDGVQWTWLVTYPNENIDGVREIVLPVDSSVRFDITSRDVLHSFWIPAFLLKIDAVPGLTTKLSLETTKTGSYSTNPNLRVQCAQLCGLSHSRMFMPVRVVEKAEYDAWVQEQAGTPTADVTPTGPVTELTIVAKNIVWDTNTLTVPAGSTVKLTIDNQDGGIPHNFSLYTSEQAATSGEKALAGTKFATGPVQEDLTFNAPPAGTYYFRCDVHPTTMTGTFIVQ